MKKQEYKLKAFNKMKRQAQFFFIVLMLFGVSQKASASFASCLFELSIGHSLKCVVEQTLEFRTYYEATVEASLFDGSTLGGGPSCAPIYGGENMYRFRRDPDALACALMLCGQDEQFNEDFGHDNSMCDWFKYVVKSVRPQDGLLSSLQDLKEYLAVIDLEQAKQQSIDNIAVLPGAKMQIYSGIKESLYRQLMYEKLDFFDVNYINDSLLAQGKRASRNHYLKNRMKNFCSDFEEGNKKEDSELKLALCPSKGYALPYDLHAATLLRENTIFGSAKQKAAKQFIKHISLPLPIPLQNPKNIYSAPRLALLGKGKAKPNNKFLLTQGGRLHLEAKYKELMMISVVEESLRQSYNARLSIESGADLNQNSLRAAIADEAKRRLHDPQWHKALSHSGKTALLREVAKIMATELALTQDMIEHTRRIEVLMAMDIVQIVDALGDGAAGLSGLTSGVAL